MAKSESSKWLTSDVLSSDVNGFNGLLVVITSTLIDKRTSKAGSSEVWSEAGGWVGSCMAGNRCKNQLTTWADVCLKQVIR